MSDPVKFETPKPTKRERLTVFGALFLFIIISWGGIIMCATTAHGAEPPTPAAPVAQGPDYVTTTGINVYDPFHHSFAEEVDVWALMTFMKAPAEDRGALFDIFDGMTVIIHEGHKIEGEVYPCGAAPEGKILLGCTDPFSKTINLAWRGCAAAPTTTAGIFSHEVGHLATFFIRGVLGHADPLWFGPDQDRMARLVAEPLCRMSK